ncbi:hypothetical protein COX68_01180 [Candidatus Falkowbacteria bacterium CG_4_10_14_0_2_um_filter_41_15]|uniref:Uncharacterized protein n=1 Tax=Candidatus Falkowbacteria bacterium CG_4_10_14_0_2_um_filter_41_15 TaxID=1974554 RepID=A0A2M7VZW5_9BACT|nr:MAG: hypothetical protein COX68_01180 [Candidatus Falkowbacteria bacterium CG_4_10_14_0_2_um_filter_41_15]
MKKLIFCLLLAAFFPLLGQAQGVMVKNYTGQKISVQIAFLRVPLEPCDSVKFKMEPGEARLLRIQFVSDKNDTCVFRKIVASGKKAVITKRDLKRYKHFFLPEKNGEPIANWKNQF